MDGEKIDWLEFFSWKKPVRSVTLNEQLEKFEDRWKFIWEN